MLALHVLVTPALRLPCLPLCVSLTPPCLSALRSYVMAANLLVPDPDHAATVTRFALRAQQEAAKVLRPDVDDGSTLQMRIGESRGLPCTLLLH